MSLMSLKTYVIYESETGTKKSIIIQNMKVVRTKTLI